jgi:hypothetical protein
VCQPTAVIPDLIRDRSRTPTKIVAHHAIPAQGRDDGPRSLFLVGLLAPLLLTACQQHNAYMPGTPEYAASIVSRGYDCGLRVERGRVVAVYQGEERRRLIATNQALAVRSYNLLRACTEGERAAVAGELRSIARR